MTDGPAPRTIATDTDQRTGTTRYLQIRRSPETGRLQRRWTIDPASADPERGWQDPRGDDGHAGVEDP